MIMIIFITIIFITIIFFIILNPHASEIGRDIHVAAAEVKLDASFGENAAKFFLSPLFSDAIAE